MNWDDGPAVWDAIMAAGADHGLRATGMGVYALTGRIEKGYRLMGAELESEYNPLEAGLARPKVKADDFIGKDAYLAARDKGEPEVHMVTLTVDDNTDAQGRPRFMQGGKGWLGSWTQNLFAALTDDESALAPVRSRAWTRILPVDFDRSPESDQGYTGWVQFEDGEIYIVNYIMENAPKAQIRGYSLRGEDFLLGG